MDLYREVIRPALFALDAERAHHLGLALAASTLTVPGIRQAVSAVHRCHDPRLATTVFGCAFTHPVGLAAGLDKNGVAVDALATLGFSHIEIGTVTGQAQPGNPQPRLFRLIEDRAVINRMGFNNQGAQTIAVRLHATYAKRRPACVLGINIGKSKVVDLEQALDDYRASVRALASLADYLVVNVSSPNTPGLRDLQGEAALRPLLSGVRAEVDALRPGLPLLLKIAPDLADAGLDAAVDVAEETRCDGLICTNTTIARAGLRASGAQVASLGAGGLSGAPLRARSTAVLAHVARRLQKRLPIIGVGGVDSAEAAWEKIGFGADLVQVYTGFIYEGPGLAARIHQGLSERLDRLGLPSIADAVGRNL